MSHAARVLIGITALLAGVVFGINISWYAAPGVTILASLYLHWLCKENNRD